MKRPTRKVAKYALEHFRAFPIAVQRGYIRLTDDGVPYVKQKEQMFEINGLVCGFEQLVTELSINKDDVYAYRALLNSIIYDTLTQDDIDKAFDILNKVEDRLMQVPMGKVIALILKEQQNVREQESKI